MDPNCLEALTSLSRCQLLMGHWLDAMKVEWVLIQMITVFPHIVSSFE
jgi:hypothetical protein